MVNDIWGHETIPGRKICMLMISHACNLNCTYCYEAYKSNKFMSLDLAKELILKECLEVQKSSIFHELEIDFMGGEPMTNFELIKDLVEWTEKNPLPVPWIFFVTSNGTLFDEKKKAWFKKYRHLIVVGVSYDGTSEMQRINRDTKHESVDMEFFHKTWPLQPFHMTISQETLPNLADGILEIQRKGYALEASLAQGVNWNNDDAEIYYQQLAKLSTAYLEDPSLCPINLLSLAVNVQASKRVSEQRQKRWCGSGTHMITYDVDGKAYGCHLFTSVVLGDKAREIDSIEWSCPEATEDPYCKECVLKLTCPTCAGFNYRFRGDISQRDHNRCRMAFVEKFMACQFQIKVLLNRRSKLEKNDAIHAKGAIAAYEILKKFTFDNLKSPFISD